VVSLPYHHPFNVAQRMVQLDYMTAPRDLAPVPARWRRMRTRSASIPDDAARSSDEAIAIIRRLSRRARHRQERLVHHERRRAAAVAAAGRDAVRGGVADLAIGHDLAGKYGIRHHFARLDVDAGPDGAANAMGIRRGRRQEAGTTVSRSDWRVLLSWHIAETREQARREAGAGLMRWHKRIISRHAAAAGPGALHLARDAIERRGRREPASTIGTPDDLVKTIKSLMAVSGGVGTSSGFVHDGQSEKHPRSWDMWRANVIPENQRYARGPAQIAKVPGRESRGVSSAQGKP